MTAIHALRKVRAMALIGCAALTGGASFAQAVYRSDGTPLAPDQQLIVDSGHPQRFRGIPSPKIAALVTRPPNASEESTVNHAQILFQRSAAKAMVLVDGRSIVWLGIKAPASEKSPFLSYSVAKSLTALAVGKAVCAKKIDLEARADQYVQEVRDTDLGGATVRDLLRMSSGVRSGERGGWTYVGDELPKIADRGEMTYLEWLQLPRINTADTFFGQKNAPGTKFAYKVTDPILLGAVVNRTVGRTFSEWLHEEVLHPAGVAAPVVVTEDRLHFAASDAFVRMQLLDWVRVAAWVEEQRRQSDCFGSFLQSATKTQIENSGNDRSFSGYGYYFWTDNAYAPDSYWAVGHGGQRIGWNTRNRRMIVVFSNAEDWMPELYRLYKEWSNIGDQ